MLAGVQQNPEVIAKRAPSSLWEGAKWMASKAWENKDVVAGMAAKYLPFLGLLEDDEDPFTLPKYCIKTNYYNALDGCMQALLTVNF